MRSQMAYGTPASAVKPTSTYEAGDDAGEDTFVAPRSGFDSVTPSAAVASAVRIQLPCSALSGSAAAWMTSSTAVGGGAGAGIGAGAGVGPGAVAPTMTVSFFSAPGDAEKNWRADRTIWSMENP